MSASLATAPWANRIVDHGEESPESLLPNPANWRLHGAAQRGALADVLGEVGLVQSVIVNRTSGHLVDGHLRVELARAAGQPTIPVVYVELSEDEERVILASLDPIAALASADREKLSELLGGIENEDLSDLLEVVARENGIVLDLCGDGLTDPDEVPEPPQEPVSKPGDLYLLGEHRLLCGDSTNSDDVERLMAGKRASLMFTDPPYLVDYDGGNHPQSYNTKGEKRPPGVSTRHWDSYTDPAQASEFFEGFLRVAFDKALLPDAAVYQCFATMRTDLVMAAWRDAGLLPHQILVWRKSRPVLTRCWFMWDWEPIMVGWMKGNQPKAKPPNNERAVWEIGTAESVEEGVAGSHPTIKPVALVARAIPWHTKRRGLMYEPFSGSGTALIAAEHTGRVCYAIEQSPAFVDVAVQRWQNFTGRKAALAKAKQGGPNG